MRYGKVLITLAGLAVAFLGGFAYARWSAELGRGSAAGERKILYWVDPMHPAYRSDKPGIAPDCGMKLVPFYADGGSAPSAHGRILFYRDPHNPKYTSPDPGLNPETGNELAPVYEGGAEAMPPGTIKVSAEKQQLIGVQFGTVQLTSANTTIRIAGRVAQDETRLTRIHPRVDGWIAKTFVDYTGQSVKKGDPLLTIYSPEMLASEQEFLLALRARDQMKDGAMKEAWGNSEMLVDASRRRLQLFDLSDTQIEELEHTRKPFPSVTLYSPASGYVTERNAYPSQRVTADTALYTLSDLSRVWVTADVFENDVASIREGQSALVTPATENGSGFRARVSYIQPQVDPQTRTVKVRLDVDNAAMRLKPDMFVNVQFSVSRGAHLLAPTDAVLDTGMKQTVFVDHGNGYLEPRQVQIGERLGDRVEIRSGIAAGERIVTSGTFLIDSESKLQAPMTGMNGGAR